MIFMGIDPGFTGAWGMIDHNGDYIACGDMKQISGRISTREVYADICTSRGGYDMQIIIEEVHSMPGQGVASMFKFGMAYGAALAIAERFLVPYELVTPQKWKRALKLSSNKDESLALARSLWPAAPLTRKKDGGRAEALLLAQYLRSLDAD